MSNNYPAPILDEYVEKFVQKKSTLKQTNPNKNAPKRLMSQKAFVSLSCCILLLKLLNSAP